MRQGTSYKINKNQNALKCKPKYVGDEKWDVSL